MSIFIWLFAILALISSLCVIFIRNSVIALLFLILTFLNICLVLLLLGLDFLSVLVLIIYIGAIAILFLFVIMMLNVRYLDLSEFFFNYFYILLIIFLIFGIFIIKFLFDFKILLDLSFETWNFWLNIVNLYNFIFVEKIHLVSFVLYSYVFVFFLVCGFILFIAMLGAILLTLVQFNRRNFNRFNLDIKFFN